MRSPEGARAASYIAVTARVARRRVAHMQGVSSGINGYMPSVCRIARPDARPSTQRSSAWEADPQTGRTTLFGLVMLVAQSGTGGPYALLRLRRLSVSVRAVIDPHGEHGLVQPAVVGPATWYGAELLWLPAAAISALCCSTDSPPPAKTDRAPRARTVVAARSSVFIVILRLSGPPSGEAIGSQSITRRDGCMHTPRRNVGVTARREFRNFRTLRAVAPSSNVQNPSEMKVETGMASHGSFRLALTL